MKRQSASLLFHLDTRSAVAPYLQLTQQVKHALRLGYLHVGDQLPTVREVVADLVINPNTVFKAYRELEHERLVASRPGQGTFIIRELEEVPVKTYATLHEQLVQWLHRARTAGLEDESITALFTATLHDLEKEQTA